MVDDGHAAIDSHQMGVDVGTEEVGLSQQLVLLLLTECRAVDAFYHVVAVTDVSPGTVRVVGHIEVVEIGYRGVIGNLLLRIDEDGESAVLLGRLGPAVGIADGCPVVGRVSAVAIAAGRHGQQPVVETVHTLLGTIVVAVDGRVVEVSVVLLLLQELVATSAEGYTGRTAKESCIDDFIDMVHHNSDKC